MIEKRKADSGEGVCSVCSLLPSPAVTVCIISATYGSKEMMVGLESSTTEEGARRARGQAGRQRHEA